MASSAPDTTDTHVLNKHTIPVMLTYKLGIIHPEMKKYFKEKNI